MAGFIAFYLKNAATLSKEVGYVPLPKELYDLAAARVNKKKTGTIFGGSSQVKVKLENLLKGN